jgi:hypothetical protein
VTIEVDSEILGCVPHRLAEWRADDDGVVIVERRKPETRGLRGFRDRIGWFMTYPRIRLDELGGAVWLRMDGSASLAEIADTIGELFPDRADEMAERTALFAAALQHQGLIELRVVKIDGSGRLRRMS